MPQENMRKKKQQAQMQSIGEVLFSVLKKGA